MSPDEAKIVQTLIRLWEAGVEPASVRLPIEDSRREYLTFVWRGLLTPDCTKPNFVKIDYNYLYTELPKAHKPRNKLLP